MKCKKEEEEEDIKKLYYVQMNQLSIKYIFIPSASTKKVPEMGSVQVYCHWNSGFDKVGFKYYL